MTAPTVSLAELGKLPLPGLQGIPRVLPDDVRFRDALLAQTLAFRPDGEGWFFDTGSPNGTDYDRVYTSSQFRFRTQLVQLAIAFRAAERWWRAYGCALWDAQRLYGQVYEYDPWLILDISNTWGHFAALLERGAEIVP